MKRFFKFFVLTFIFIGLTTYGYSAGVLTSEEMSFIDRFIDFLENIDLDGIHMGLSAVIATLLVILKLFKNKLKKAAKQ